jgi:hypothetical protein
VDAMLISKNRNHVRVKDLNAVKMYMVKMTFFWV